MTSTAEQIVDLKRQAIALKESGDTNGAMALLAQARDQEFENAAVEGLWDVLKLKQFAVVMKKRGDLDVARQALIKAKQIEKGELAEETTTTQSAANEAPKQAPPAPKSQEESPTPQASPQEEIPVNNEPTPEQKSQTTANDDDDDLEALMRLDQPNDIPVDVEFTIEEMADREMMTEFNLGGMPVPSEEEYQAKILECKKAALAAKKVGNTALALQELQKSKQLEAVRLALSQIGDGQAGDEMTDDVWMGNLNAEESELLGELLPKKQPSHDTSALKSATRNNTCSDHIEDVLEELAGFMEDPALFLDALDMGMEVPTVEGVEAKSQEQKMIAVEQKKAGNLEGAKRALIKSKQFTAHALKLKELLKLVEQKKGGSSNGDGSNVKLEDLEAMLEADEKKTKQAPKAPEKEPLKKETSAEKTSNELREEAVRLRDQKQIKEAGEVLKFYKAALKREEDAAERQRRAELVGEIRKEVDFAQGQIRIWEYYQRFCDPDSQQVEWWKEYITRCNNVSKVVLSKGTGAIKIARKKTTMLSARQSGGVEGEEDFNGLIADLLGRGPDSDPPDERMEISIVDFNKLQENTNLQKLFKKQKRENLPEHPWTVRLEVQVQLPPNEHDTDKSIELVYEPSWLDPLKNLELTTAQESGEDINTCLFDKSEYVDLERGNSAYGKIIRRRIERKKKISICAYHVPVAAKKGWFFKKNKEELPPPTLLGKVVLDMHGLMTKKCCAAGEYPLMNGSGSKALGGVLKLTVRTGVPFMKPREEDDAAGDPEEEPLRTKLEPYKAMVFTSNKQGNNLQQQQKHKC